MFSRAQLCDRPVYRYVTEQKDVAEIAREIRRSRYVALDTETTGLRPFHGDRVRLMSISLEAGFTWVVDCFKVDPRAIIRSLKGRKVIAHNWAFDANMLLSYGFRFESIRLRDTNILGFLLHCGSGKKSSLGVLLHRYLNLEVDKTFQKSDWSVPVLSEEQLDYAARDTQHLIKLYKLLMRRCTQAGLMKIVALEHHVLRAVLWMMRTGVKVDTQLWTKLYEQAIEARKEQDRAMRALVSTRVYGAAWDWRKKADITSALFRLGVRVKSTAKKKLAMELDGVTGPPEEFIRLLLQWRKSDQVVKSFGPKWLSHVTSSGTIHAQPQQCRPETGRFSYSNPNLQQIIKGPHRNCFPARPGYAVVKADYSGIELRMMAHKAQDAEMIEAFQNNADLHRMTAQDVLHVPEPTKNDRFLAKAINFGLLYGMGPDTLQENLAANWNIVLPLDKCAEYKTNFFRKYVGVARYLEVAKKQTAAAWRSDWGRRRLGMEPKYSEKTNRVSNQFMKWANTPIQGTSADGNKAALALVYKRRKQIPGLKLLMTVHDEIVLEVPEKFSFVALKWLESIMIEAMQPLLGVVPCAVEGKVGKTWGG